MSSNTSLIDVLVETQTKVVENLLETSKKVQETFGSPDAFEKSQDLYKEWFDKQKSIMETLTSSLQESMDSEMEKIPMPDFMKDMMDSQRKFMSSLMDNVKEMSANYSSEKMLDSYHEQTNKMFASWKESYDQMVDQMGKPFSDMKYNPADFAKEMHEQFLETTRGYLQMVATEEPAKKETKKATKKSAK